MAGHEQCRFIDCDTHAKAGELEVPGDLVSNKGTEAIHKYRPAYCQYRGTDAFQNSIYHLEPVRNQTWTSAPQRKPEISPFATRALSQDFLRKENSKI